MAIQGFNRWFSCNKPRYSPEIRLFCFPFAGGGSSIFRSWGSLVPEWIECLAVKLPGREDRIRERPFTRIPDLTRALEPEILPLLDRPFAFYGHSMGTLIAFDLALRLRRSRGLGPAVLLAGGGPAPGNDITNADFKRYSDAGLLDEARSYGGDFGPALDDPDFRAFVLSLLRADFELNDTYAPPPEARLDCPLAVFGGSEDPKVSQAQLAAWRCRTRGTFDLHMVPGGHFFLNSYRDLLLSKIENILYSVIPPRTGGFAG